MIDLPAADRALIEQILARLVPGCEVRAFGSRVDGTAREFSDLDLALVGDGKLEWAAIEGLKDALAASNLGITVDVVDWHAISPEFRQVIERRYEVLRRGEGH